MTYIVTVAGSYGGDPPTRTNCETSDIRSAICNLSPDWPRNVYGIIAYNGTKSCRVSSPVTTKEYAKEMLQSGVPFLTESQLDEFSVAIESGGSAVLLKESECSLRSWSYPYFSKFTEDSPDYMTTGALCQNDWPQYSSLMQRPMTICD